MFTFLDLHSTTAPSQDQGILFEKLVRDLVEASGYNRIELRAKRASMEYDITAFGKLDDKPLVGEAKAHAKKIDGPAITSFVGKMHPIWHKEPGTLGLFVSTSDFTPDAKDFLRTLKEEKSNLKTIIGQDILDSLAREKQYMTIGQVRNSATTQYNVRCGDTLFLVSDRGNFYIQLLIRKDETRAASFCIFHSDGSPIDDFEFGKTLKNRMAELEGLLFWPKELKRSSLLGHEQNRMSPLQGTGWFDYRFPAPPDCFVGRLHQRADFKSFVDRAKTRRSSVSVFQVLSRSGVGKSSFLLKLQSDLSGTGAVSTIADARNFRSSIDLLELTQGLVQSLNRAYGTIAPVPNDFHDYLSSMEEASRQLKAHDNVGVLFVDQFESLFAKPELYIAFLDFLKDTTLLYSDILFCIARKNDQPTTYDDRAKIDLAQLREISHSVVLEDFSREEAVSLIVHIEDEIGQPLLDRLKEMTLEFSQGFPWLHKRICAHIISMVRRGETQEELVQAGLKLEELFREELADLDEIEADFLRRLAQYLPSTLDQLSEVFTDGDILARRINSLQTHRLIRVTGRTYDTYNDVLKEYLKTGRVPFSMKYVFRVGPVATLNLLDRIRTHNWRSLADIREKERKKIGSIYNRVRELRLLGLLEYSKGNVKLTEATINAYEDGTIGYLIQDRVKQNGLVKDVLDRIATSERLTIPDLRSLMRSSMPLLEVSDDTWDTYARALASWLERTKLATQTGGSLAFRRDKGTISREELAKGGKRRGLLQSDYFLPSAYVNELFALLDAVRRSSMAKPLVGDSERPQGMDNAQADCLTMGLLAKEGGATLVLTPLGKRFSSNIGEAKEIMKGFLLSRTNVVQYLTRVDHNPTPHLNVLKDTLADQSLEWTQATWEWRSKIMTNWLVWAELIKRRKGRVASYPVKLF